MENIDLYMIILRKKNKDGEFIEIYMDREYAKLRHNQEKNSLFYECKYIKI